MTHNAPIFIVGAARSGTTLLQFMLRSHPELSLPTAESHFFIPFYQHRSEFGDLTNIGELTRLLKAIYDSRKIFFDEDVHGIRFNAESLAQRFHSRQLTSIPEVISGIFEANAEAEGKRRWGDKTPYYILHLDTLLEMFPNAQFVHIIRDGRDCALSMLERKWDLQIFNTYHAAYTWNKYVNAGIAFGQQHPDHYHALHYESLLNEPEQTVANLCHFLNIEFNERVIDFNKTDGSGKTPLLGQPLQKSNQEKWRKKMTSRQIRIFETLAGATLKRCGYSVIHENPKINFVEWFISELQIKIYHTYCRFFLHKK